MYKSLLSLVLLLLSWHTAFAGEGLVGFEWTFTNSDIVSYYKSTPDFPDMPLIPGRGIPAHLETPLAAQQNSPSTQATQAWLDEIRRVCPDCIITNNTVNTPNGFWFKITLDQTVLEVLTEPMTLEQLIERSEILDLLVWRSAKRVGLLPHARLGGGHIHLDKKTNFQGDRTLFRNFVVDLMNRPELFMGGLGLNYFNAPPLSFYGPQAAKSFKRIVSDFDKDQSITVQNFMEKINTLYKDLNHPVTPTPSDRFQALNFKHFEIGTLEIRAIRPQISVEHAARLVKMFQSRIDVLKNTTELIKVKIPDHSKAYQADRVDGHRLYTHNLKASTVMAAVQDYAIAGGLPADFYDEFITEELKRDLKAEAARKKTRGNNSAGFCGAFL